MDRRAYLGSVAGTFALAGCIGDGGEASEDLPSTATRGDLEVSFSQMYAKRYFRYHDSESDELRELRPDSEWWIETSLRITNLGGEPVERPDPSTFRLRAGDDVVDGHTEVPGVEWDSIRLREHGETYWFEPGYVAPGGEIGAGDDALLYLLFDAPADTDPELLWDVDGETIALAPEFVLEPE